MASFIGGVICWQLLEAGVISCYWMLLNSCHSWHGTVYISSMYGGHTLILLLDVNRGDDGVHGVLNVVVHQVLILVVGYVSSGGGGELSQTGHRGQGDQFRR